MSDLVVILYGGASSEREVSCMSAAAVAKAMDEMSIPHQKMELVGDWIHKLREINPAFAFLALHGSPGEDGTVQAVLNFLNIPYNGSHSAASALAMDKSRAKKVVSASGGNVAKERIYQPFMAPENFDDVGMDLPVVVKPVNGGSSLGTTIVRTKEKWPEALEHIKNHGTIMVEEFINGREFSVGMLGGMPLAVTEIVVPKEDFYNYAAKYEVGGSEHIIPAEVDVYDKIMEAAIEVTHALGCTGVSRVDFLYDEKAKRLVFLEANTLPGLTATSLVPEQAAHRGMNFNKLILWMMEEAGWQHKKTA